MIGPSYVAYIGSCIYALFPIGCAIQAVFLKPGQVKFSTNAQGRLSPPTLPASVFGAYCCICWWFWVQQVLHRGGYASKVFHGRGSLKAQGGISSWVPELDPKFLGDSNAGQPFLQVLSIGREAERAPPACKKILPRSLLVCCLFQPFSSTKKDRRLRKHH